ncbi:MAG: XRE family transcriptional regulator [Betaproteobacteria bacterium]|nr:XRE family transcriptional regulator [Betaproteobacteria bacterium]NBS22323.1 XRE family transcriptional regulator [Betaproteobacteria bacterium]NCV39268.1 XRE family transcriptional regulator [Betaproteobacteria bacterium]NCV56384.1 XRE family transcriptional regulator [Betaproteobacteria bacterium]NCV57849.1 XRE family transcriptional regulator [Betaproteobacteria bacterium]
MKVQTINRDGKPEYVVLPWAEYQALLEAAEDAIDGALLDAFRQKLATGQEETIPATIVDMLLAGANPIKVWREYRGLTQDALANQAGISKAYLCQIETGKREGAIKTLRAIATALGVTVDELQ